jgi:hypothetical protein
LPGNLPDLGEEALGLGAASGIGADTAGLRPEAVLVVGAHGRASGQKHPEIPDFGLWCRWKASKAKALRE